MAHNKLRASRGVLETAPGSCLNVLGLNKDLHLIDGIV
jgi:hypothetical protein